MQPSLKKRHSHRQMEKDVILYPPLCKSVVGNTKRHTHIHTKHQLERFQPSGEFQRAIFFRANKTHTHAHTCTHTHTHMMQHLPKQKYLILFCLIPNCYLALDLTALYLPTVHTHSLLVQMCCKNDMSHRILT